MKLHVMEHDCEKQKIFFAITSNAKGCTPTYQCSICKKVWDGEFEPREYIFPRM